MAKFHRFRDELWFTQVANLGKKEFKDAFASIVGECAFHGAGAATSEPICVCAHLLVTCIEDQFVPFTRRKVMHVGAINANFRDNAHMLRFESLDEIKKGEEGRELLDNVEAGGPDRTLSIEVPKVKYAVCECADQV